MLALPDLPSGDAYQCGGDPVVLALPRMSAKVTVLELGHLPVWRWAPCTHSARAGMLGVGRLPAWWQAVVPTLPRVAVLDLGACAYLHCPE